MVTRATLEERYLEYIKLPTSIRELRTDSSVNNIKNALTSFYKFVGSDEIPTGAELTDKLREWAVHHSDLKMATRYNYLSHLCLFFSEYRYLDMEITSRLRRRYKEKVSAKWSEKALTPEQIATLLNMIANEGLHNIGILRSYVAVASLLLTGSRVTAFLECKHWKLEVDYISFGITRAKNSNQDIIWKDVPLGITLPDGRIYRDVVMRYISERARKYVESEYFICMPKGTPIKGVIFGKWLRRRNFPFYVTPHVLRHTAATIVTENVGLLQASALLDHSSITTTQRYLKKDPKSTFGTILHAWSGYELTTEIEPGQLKPATAIMHSPAPEVQSVIDEFLATANTEAQLRKWKSGSSLHPPQPTA